MGQDDELAGKTPMEILTEILTPLVEGYNARRVHDEVDRIAGQIIGAPPSAQILDVPALPAPKGEGGGTIQ